MLQAGQVAMQSPPVPVAAIEPGYRIDAFVQKKAGQRDRGYLAGVPGILRDLDSVHPGQEFCCALNDFVHRRLGSQRDLRGDGERFAGQCAGKGFHWLYGLHDCCMGLGLAAFPVLFR